MQPQNLESQDLMVLPVSQPLTGDRPTIEAQKGDRPSGFKRFFGRLGIRQKIGYGYALAATIAIGGAIAGHQIEELHKTSAREQLHLAHEAATTIAELQNSIQLVRTYQQRLIIDLNANRLTDYEFHRIKQELVRLEGFINSSIVVVENNHLKLDNSYHQQNYNKLRDLLGKYRPVVENYLTQFNQTLDTIHATLLNPTEANRAQQTIASFVKTDTALQFLELSHDLASLVTALQDEEQEEFQDYQEAEALGTTISFLSLLIAAAISAILAIYTSHAIAHPLEVTTKVARQVTEEGNFKLQAPVTTQDEVGILTTSLNQLIQWVDRYTQELQQTQAQLIQTEKMSSLGQLVAGVAHEINNPITFIQGNINYLDESLQDLFKLVTLYQGQSVAANEEIEALEQDLDLDFLREDLPNMLRSMHRGTERIEKIVQSLRNFSRLDESELKMVDLHEGLESTLVMVHSKLDDRIEVVKDYGDLPEVECYPAQLNQVFLNVIQNAIDAVLDRDDLPENKRQICIITRQLDRDRVQVRIEDNGAGIPVEIQNKIFDPFFTTKPVGRGTGLGLAVSYRIIEQHGGTVQISSQVGRGTQVTIALSVKASESAGSPS
ncbi:ATP-binding protein [Oxynema aestuarii]|jgi:two-component system NtrC family sensor kinase|uniref:histidine kinase n=1 Tax=Oxynema aestuarii AP17 TaxID=2064643 RepID=A0A6H1TZC6_9CYAN|nr:ATP-binding protein [Oxynema aestuarii]QIZ71270.1 HAMP domain-containing protein [Oxynema aestuarii AP17]